jgi:hypothetical protein
MCVYVCTYYVRARKSDVTGNRVQFQVCLSLYIQYEAHAVKQLLDSSTLSSESSNAMVLNIFADWGLSRTTGFSCLK